MAPLPKRRHSTRRGGKRWLARLNEFKKRFENLNLLADKNKHLRSRSTSK